MSSVVLVSDWTKTSKTLLPESFILPLNQRPEDAEISNDIPVIDLSLARSEEGKLKLLEDIIRAGQDYGLFQVINHEVPAKLMDDAMSVGKGFFDLPAEEKAKLYSPEYIHQGTRLYSGKFRRAGKATNNWRDVLEHSCHPVQDYIQSWPDNPPAYREVIGAYSVKVKELGLKILDLMCEGLGIESGYFEDELSKTQTLTINSYPPCPDPTMTIGALSHFDPNVLTILQQEVYGLQMCKDGKWIGVKPLPHTFVIIIAAQLEAISNGKLKCVEHRAITNSEVSRTTLVNFLSPSMDSIIEPKGLAEEPPKFKTFKYKDYYEIYINKSKRLAIDGCTDGEPMEAIEHFKL